MGNFLTPEERDVLIDALRVYLTDLRSEIHDADDFHYKQSLKHEEEVLKVIVSKLEKEGISQLS